MEVVSLIVGALLITAGFLAGAYVYGGEDDREEYRDAYKKEYAKQNGLYQPRRR